MANQYENPDAEHVHITHINDTKAGLLTQLDNCQIAIETDFEYDGETVPVLSFRDHNGVYREVTVFDNLAHKIEDHIDFTEADCFPSPSFVVYDTELGMYKPWQAYREWQHTGSTLVTDFNADKLDGFHAASFALFDHLHDTRYSQIEHSQDIATITGLQDALNSKWSSSNDGSGSGLDADLLDGYHGLNFLGKNGTSYYQVDNWIQFNGTYGLYFPNSGSGTHIHPNDSQTYGSFSVWGAKNGYHGFHFSESYNNLTLMYRASDGLGGMYYQATSTWQWYYDPAIENIRIMGNYPVWHSNNLTGDQTGHYHSSDRNRAVHTGTQAISTIANLQTSLDGKLSITLNTTDTETLLRRARDSSNTRECKLTWDGYRYVFTGYLRIDTLNNVSTIANKVLILDSTNDLRASEVSGTELGFLLGKNSVIDGSGTAGYIPYFSQTKRLANSPLSIINDNLDVSASRHLYVNGSGIFYNDCYVYNSTNIGTYIGVFKSKGSLPGYPDSYYPVIKTDTGDIYFSCNGRYTGYLGNDEFGLFDSNMVGRIRFVTNGNSYIDSTSGNFGIGTSSPQYKLHVSGTAVATADIAANNAVYAYNTTKPTQGTFIGCFKGAGSLPGYDNDYYPTLKTDSEYLYFAAGGKYTLYMYDGVYKMFGINRDTLQTTTPDCVFLGNSYSDGTTRDKLKIYLFNNSTDKSGFGVGSNMDIQYHCNGMHDFYINNSRIIRINSSGIYGGNFNACDGADFNSSLLGLTRVTTAMAAANGPFGNNYWYNMISIQYSAHSDYGGQLAWGMTAYTNRMAFRARNMGSFTDWKEVLTTDHINSANYSTSYKLLYGNPTAGKVLFYGGDEVTKSAPIEILSFKPHFQADTYFDDDVFMTALPGASGGGYILRIQGSDGMVYRDTSSIKYKENVNYTINTDWIYDLKVCRYNRKADKNKKIEIGIIAEEFERVCPELTIRDKNGDVDSWDKLDMVPILIDQIQKLKKEIDFLKGNKK